MTYNKHKAVLLPHFIEQGRRYWGTGGTPDENTSTNEIFALLDAVDNDDEEDIDNELNDSDTEFYIEDSAELDKPKISNDDTHMSLLTPQAHVHNLKEESKGSNNKKEKRKVRNQVRSKGVRRIKAGHECLVVLKPVCYMNFLKTTQPTRFMKKLLN